MTEILVKLRDFLRRQESKEKSIAMFHKICMKHSYRVEYIEFLLYNKFYNELQEEIRQYPQLTFELLLELEAPVHVLSNLLQIVKKEGQKFHLKFFILSVFCLHFQSLLNSF